MSGMFEPKQDKANRKIERTKKEETAKKKSRMRAIIIISVLIVFSAAAITINSGFIRRSAAVVTIDGVNFTTVEFEYFFNNEYMEYVNFMSQFQGMGAVPDTGRSLSNQIYDHNTGETWADFIMSMALNRMSGLTALYNAAQASGFELTAEHKESIDEDLVMIEIQAMINGFPNTNSLLQQMFGTGMNVRSYRKIMEFVTTANAYSEHIRESFTYSSADLAEYYAEFKDDLDVFTYRQFTIYFDYPESDDFDDVDEFEAALDEAMENSRIQAAEIAAEITGEDDFIQAAYDYSDFYSDPDSTLRLAQGNRLDINTSDWLLDPARVNGDITIADSEQGSIIIFFVSRDDNNYRTVGMRQILILRESIYPDDFPLGEDDPGYIAAFNAADDEAKQRAEQVLSLFTVAGSTEDALIALMPDHSDDNTEGGFYSDISKFPYQSSYIAAMKVVEEIEDWLFYENRQIGDSELVRTEDFGYHLLYFTGPGDVFFELMAKDRMRTRDHTEWLENLETAQPIRRAAFILVHI